MVLSRIEYFEQRRRRIAAPVGAELVDFIQHDHGIHRAGIAQGAYQPPRQCSDVCTAMATDLRFIANTAERHPDKLTACRTGDRFTDRCFPGSWRSNQREYRTRSFRIHQTALGAQLADSQVLGDATL